MEIPHINYLSWFLLLWLSLVWYITTWQRETFEPVPRLWNRVNILYCNKNKRKCGLKGFSSLILELQEAHCNGRAIHMKQKQVHTAISCFLSSQKSFNFSNISFYWFNNIKIMHLFVTSIIFDTMGIFLSSGDQNSVTAHIIPK